MEDKNDTTSSQSPLKTTEPENQSAPQTKKQTKTRVRVDASEKKKKETSEETVKPPMPSSDIEEVTKDLSEVQDRTVSEVTPRKKSRTETNPKKVPLRSEQTVLPPPPRPEQTVTPLASPARPTRILESSPSEIPEKAVHVSVVLNPTRRSTEQERTSTHQENFVQQGKDRGVETPLSEKETVIFTSDIGEQLEEIIDSYLLENQNAEISLTKEVKIIQEKGVIFLGLDSDQSETGVDTTGKTLMPITTIDQLEQMLDVYNQITLAFGLPTIQDSENAFETHGMNEMVLNEELNNSLEILIQKLTPPKEGEVVEFKLFVSEEMMSVIGKVVEMLDTYNEKKPEKDKSKLKKKQMITLVSENREIVVEVQTVRETIKMIKKRKTEKDVSVQEQVTAIEELGLHTMQSQKWNDIESFWFVYQLVVLLLARAEENDFLLSDIIFRHQMTPSMLHT